jgi:hypothetical protein
MGHLLLDSLLTTLHARYDSNPNVDSINLIEGDTVNPSRIVMMMFSGQQQLSFNNNASGWDDENTSLQRVPYALVFRQVLTPILLPPDIFGLQSQAQIINITDSTLAGELPSPTNLAAIVTDFDTATLEWDAVTGANQYIIGVKLSTDIDYVFVSQSLLVLFLVDLEQGLLYNWNVTAKNTVSDDESATISGPNFTQTLPTPTSPTTSSITSTTANLSVDAEDNATSYSFFYKKSVDPTYNPAIIETSPATLLFGLNNAENYDWYCVANSDYIDSPPTTIQHFATPA